MCKGGSFQLAVVPTAVDAYTEYITRNSDRVGHMGHTGLQLD